MINPAKKYKTMKMYLRFSLLLCLTNISQAIDHDDLNNQSPDKIRRIQTNQDNVTLHLQLKPTVRHSIFSILSIQQQKEANIALPQTTQNILCIGNDQRMYHHIQFPSPHPVDCSRAIIKHEPGSHFARITIPRIKE